MRRLLLLPIFAFLFLVSCVEMPLEELKDATVGSQPPVLDISCSLIGSYSAQFVCKIATKDRTFIKGEFEYSTDPSFSSPLLAIGLIIDNVLSITVADIEEDSVYYLRAKVSDKNDTFMSEPISFKSSSFKVDNNTYRIGWKSTKEYFSVKTNVEVSIDLVEPSWVHIDNIPASNAEDVQTYTIFIDENTDLNNREISIPVHSVDGYFRDTLSILQDCHPVDFADKYLYEFMVNNYDKNSDGEIELTEIEALTEIDIDADRIFSLEGLQYCNRLERLVMHGSATNSGQLKGIDLSCFPYLRYLDISNNKLKDIDISPCKNLKTLLCSGNNLKSIDFSRNEPLETIDCSSNYIEMLDLTNNTSLERLNCSHNAINCISGNHSSALKDLDCSYNVLKTLDIRRSSGLVRVNCSWNTIKELNLNDNHSLQALDCSNNELSSLYVRKNTELNCLYCSNNAIASLNVSHNIKLSKLDCSNTSLSLLDLLDNVNLTFLDCSYTHLESLDVTGLGLMKDLYCNNPKLAILYVSDDMIIEGITVNRSSDRINNDTVVRSHSMIASGFDDPHFISYLLKYYDINNDGKLSLDEVEKVTSVSICTDNIRSLGGIEQLSNLRYLSCEGSVDNLGKVHGMLENLDVSKNHMLELLLCDGNKLSSLDLSGNSYLRTLWCFKNNLSTLDLSNNPELEDLNCENNNLRTLDLTLNPKLASLDCSPMNDSNGHNLLETIFLSAQTIKYVNHYAEPRNPSNVPSGTMLFYKGAGLDMGYMFNYNAKLYDEETRTIPNVWNAQWRHDLVFNGGFVLRMGNYLQISPGACMNVSYPDADTNPFNRNDESQTLTIIAKVAGDNPGNYSIFSNRGDDNGYNYMLREGTESENYFYFHDNRPFGSAPSVTVNKLPAIVVVRADNKNSLLICSYDNGHFTKKNITYQNWGNQSSGLGFFCGGINMGEFWSGKFYWMFLSLEELTDDEILRVIDYNETL